MKWLIKNPAPADERQQMWGDFHFGRSLSKALERQGHSVATQYHPEWECREHADIVMVFRGKYPYQRQGINKDALHLLWNISHPADVTAEEFKAYDRVFIASESHARTINRLMPGRSHALLQCTDPDQFYPREDGAGEAERRDVIFVGNTRSERREFVLAAASAFPRMKIWGRGWRHFGLGEQVVADYIDNTQLGDLYRSARLCINDHWPDMLNYGFINNRIFDALVCGLPVLSDSHVAMKYIFSGEAVTVSTADSAASCLTSLFLRYPAVIESAARASEDVLARHTFSVRADQMVASLA